MSADTTTIAPTDLALARSVLYSALTAGFRRPDEGTVRRLAAPDAERTLSVAAAVVDAPAPAGAVSAAVASLTPRLVSLEPGRVRVEYDRLFGHTARGLVCPFETEYGPSELFLQAHELADLAGFYLAFGVRPQPGGSERVDHIACECEFADLLCRKEAVELELQGRVTDAPAETLEETRKAARAFLRGHLARFGLAFATVLDRADAGSVYNAFGHLLASFLEAECERLHVPIGPRTLEPRSGPDSDDVPAACGSGPEILQIQRRPPAGT